MAVNDALLRDFFPDLEGQDHIHGYLQNIQRSGDELALHIPQSFIVPSFSLFSLCLLQAVPTPLVKPGGALTNAGINSPYPKDYDFDKQHLVEPAPLPLNKKTKLVVRNAYNCGIDAFNVASETQTELARAAAGRGDKDLPDVGAPLRAFHPFTADDITEVLKNEKAFQPMCVVLSELVHQAKLLRDGMSPSDKLEGSLQDAPTGLMAYNHLIPAPIIAAFAAHIFVPLLALTNRYISRYANGELQLPTLLDGHRASGLRPLTPPLSTTRLTFIGGALELRPSSLRAIGVSRQQPDASLARDTHPVLTTSPRSVPRPNPTRRRLPGTIHPRNVSEFPISPAPLPAFERSNLSREYRIKIRRGHLLLLTPAPEMTRSAQTTERESAS
ncbi:hypothetical protein HMN09_00495100 [Mycena chlorophos]|uniref:Uncharacterized protein n=1 Tax=Mycena chlorophos TaxID=658473 RepID=A0A8H6T7R7_MYCCL|nr:hypothetical protein HMN09_00495100 [Mycena chlorophos]